MNPNDHFDPEHPYPPATEARGLEMNDAPEQIWIDDEKYEHHWHILPEGMIPPVDYRHVLGRYIRADLASAQVAAAYERAEEACTNIIKNYDVMKADGKTYESLRVQKAAKGMVSLAREDIRALTPDDASAALDAMRLEVTTIEGIKTLQADNARLREALEVISNHSPMFDYAAVNAGKVDRSLPGSPFDRGRAQEAKHLSSIARAALPETDPASEAPDMTRPGNVTHEI